MIYDIRLTPSAERDLIQARMFYAKTDPSLGQYCVDSLMLDIERLRYFAGIHPLIENHFRMLSHRFPFSIYYQVHANEVLIVAVLDSRISLVKRVERLKFTKAYNQSSPDMPSRLKR